MWTPPRPEPPPPNYESWFERTRELVNQTEEPTETKKQQREEDTKRRNRKLFQDMEDFLKRHKK